ncbi:MAG: hypothetical protein CVU11_13145 [Bacteroidetes bacterium HGW-Bacteroidetes-6]|jgi:hypothetical protein|nr:MAG: hypothetical protein CVU11_13145 [Bacteroidetes bacterium HGW-Bacteroidetes-6]
MISIRIDRQYWLNLRANTELEVSETSPVFSEKVFEENSVYNFTVPNNPNNAAIFGHPNRTMALNAPTAKHHIEIFSDNRLKAEGTTYVVKVSGASIEIVSALNESSFYALYGDKKITEFEYDGQLTYIDDYNGNTGSILNVCDGTFPEEKFAYFPVKNVALFDGSDWEDGWRNDVLSRQYQNDYIPSSNLYPGYLYRPGRISVTPFPYAGYIIEKIFEECGYTVTYNVFRHDDKLKRLCIYNPNLIFSVGPNREYFYIQLKNHLPGITVTKLLSAIKTPPFAINYAINENTKTVEIRTFNQLNDARDSIEFKDEGSDITEQKSVKYKVHVDSGDSYAQKWQRPDDIEKYRNRGTYYNITDLSGITFPIEGDIALVLENNYFYQFFAAQDGSMSWEKAFYNIQNVVVGTGEITEAPMKFSTVFQSVEDIHQQLTSSDDRWCVPVVEIAGNSKNKPLQPGMLYNEFELKLMFYWGMDTTEDEEFAFPTGSSGIYKAGVDNPGRYLSLIPNEPYSFIEVYLDRYQYSLTNNRVKKGSSVMSIPKLENLNWLRTILLEGRIWLPTKKKYKLRNNGISPVDLELTEVN